MYVGKGVSVLIFRVTVVSSNDSLPAPVVTCCPGIRLDFLGGKISTKIQRGLGLFITCDTVVHVCDKGGESYVDCHTGRWSEADTP